MKRTVPKAVPPAVFALLFTHACILGAWLAGASVSMWAFGLAWVFSGCIGLAHVLVSTE